MINLALVGVGKWGKNYLSTIQAFRNSRIKYLCSKTKETLQSFDGSFVKTTDYRDLFKINDIDGVIIATPGSTHFRIAEEFLKRGFNLLIEKPLTLNYEESLKLLALKEKTKAKVLVGHIYLFDPAFLKVKELLKKIGAIQYISYEGLNNGPFRSDMSVLWDLGSHAISLILEINKKNPTQIQAWGLGKLRPKTSLYDVVFINLRFPDQSQAFVRLNWLSPVKRRELVITGSKSTVCYNDLNSRRLSFYDKIGPAVKGNIVIRNDSTEQNPSYNKKLPLEVELAEFIDAISKNRNIGISDISFGVEVTKLLDLAQQSIQQNSKVFDVIF